MEWINEVDWQKVGSFVGSWWGVISPAVWVGLTGLWVTVRRQVIPGFVIGFNRARNAYGWATARNPSTPVKPSALLETALMLCQDGLKWKFEGHGNKNASRMVHSKGTVLNFSGTTLTECILGGLDILPRLTRSERNQLKNAAASCLEDLQIRLAV